MKYELPIEVRNYFELGRKKVRTVIANDNFTLSITFDNNETRIYDMNKTLAGDVFAPFRKIENFKRVYVDSHGCIAWDIDPNVNSEDVWSNKVDLCPDSCYIYSVPTQAGTTMTG